MLQRAYSLLELKSVDEDQRVIEGIASTPETDRQGDIVEPKGASFTLPIPFLWQHRSSEPIGHVVDARITDAGIKVKIQIAKIDEPGKLKDRLDEAWQSIKARLVRGLSIGFDPIESSRIEGTFGYRFLKWTWLELSGVTIAANASASIQSIKSLDAAVLAALGTGTRVPSAHLPGVTGRSSTGTQMTNSERLTKLKTDLTAKSLRMEALLKKETEDGLTLDAAESAEFKRLQTESGDMAESIGRLTSLEQAQAAIAKGVTVGDFGGGSRARAEHTVIVGKSTLPPGIGFARAVICKTAAFLDHGAHGTAADLAKRHYPSHPEIEAYIKATIPGGTTTGTTWASPLIDQVNLGSEFVDFLRPKTIIGQFGQNGIPALTRVPFNVKISGMTHGGTGYWVGEGKPKPMTKMDFDSRGLTYNKVASLTVISQELARFSSPSADQLVRDALAKNCIRRMDQTFVDPAAAAVSGVSPASLTNGVTALTSAGTSADNIRTDIARLINQFVGADQDVSSIVLIMSPAMALAASLMRNSLGVKEFPDLSMNGGRIEGLPVITSSLAANASGSGNMVIAVIADEIFLADDGNVEVKASTEASLQMLDNPTTATDTGTAVSLVSMFQTNSIALLAEREVTWVKGRITSVAFLDDVNWGSVGSPV